MLWALDVDVERHIDRRSDRRDLPEGQIRRQVDRARAEVGDHARGRRIRDRQHDRDLRLHIRRQLARRAHRREHRESAHILEKHAPEPVTRRAPGIVKNGDELFDPTRRGSDERPHRSARHRRDVPPCVRPREKADFDAGFRAKASHLVELLVRVHEDAASLRDAHNRNVAALGLVEHGLERERSLGARDLHAVVRAVRKTPHRVRKLPEVVVRQSDRGEEASRCATGH